ncbi:MAG: ROK family protein [Gemmiger sp.]|nr:ROK family protein [Gemmiger sp.]
MDITANHLGLVLVNMAGEVVKSARTRVPFSPGIAYYHALAGEIQAFWEKAVDASKILGIGFSLPGIIQANERVLVKSHALHLENYSLKMIEQVTPFPAYFENDANASLLAENMAAVGDAIYLSLNNTLGGAICMGDNLFAGQNKKAGEFGHMVLVPGGKKCYCGKQGCADAYCASSVLTENGATNLEDFMAKIGHDAKADAVWHQYLDKLAILISNLRMAYDTDIILGGELGPYLAGYSMELGENLFRYNLLDGDLTYLRYGRYRKEAAAVGVAKHFLRAFAAGV